MQDIISLLTSTQLQENIFWLRIVFFAVSGIFGGIIIFALIRTNWLKYRFIEDLVGFFTYKPLGTVKVVKKWEKIAKRLKLGSEDEYKMAVLEAEEMLEATLERLGYSGEHLKEKLDKLPSIAISNIEQLKKVLQIRNEIVYNPDYRLSLDEAKKTLDIFEQVLKDLQVF